MPLAEAVVFAMLASYILSRTLVPDAGHVSAASRHDHVLRPTRNPFVLLQRAVRTRLRAPAPGLSAAAHHLRLPPLHLRAGVPRALRGGALLLFPWLGQDFFPTSDNGQFRLHLRARTGTRIEETARLNDLVDQSIRRTIPAAELDSIVDNMGLPYSGINTTYNTSGVIGSADADILVSLKEGHHRPTAGVGARRSGRN